MINIFLKDVNFKSLLITMLAVFIYIFASDFIIHGLLLKSSYHATSELWRSESEMQSFMPWMLFGQLLIAKYFTLLFVKGYNGTGIMEGIRFGVLIGFFSVGAQCIQYAVMPMPLSLLFSWAGLGLIQAITGGVIASLIYKKT